MTLTRYHIVKEIYVNVSQKCILDNSRKLGRLNRSACYITPPFPLKTYCGHQSVIFHSCKQKQTSHVDRITGLWSLQQHTCQWVPRLDFELSMTGNTNYKQMLGLDTSIFTVTKINLLDKLHWLTSMIVARVEVQSSAKWSTKATLSKWNTIIIWWLSATNLVKSKEKNGIFSSRSLTFPQNPLNDTRVTILITGSVHNGTWQTWIKTLHISKTL